MIRYNAVHDDAMVADPDGEWVRYRDSARPLAVQHIDLNDFQRKFDEVTRERDALLTAALDWLLARPEQQEGGGEHPESTKEFREATEALEAAVVRVVANKLP